VDIHVHRAGFQFHDNRLETSDGPMVVLTDFRGFRFWRGGHKCPPYGERMSFFSELKRRNVIRVGFAYGVLAG